MVKRSAELDPKSIDKYIALFPFECDDDLNLCRTCGVAYQRDMTCSIEYGEDYFKHYVDLESSKIAYRLNAGRMALVNKYVGSNHDVLDIGIGSGEFIKTRSRTSGYDVNPVAISWLRKKSLFVGDFSQFNAFTMWDVLEHVRNPNIYFSKMKNESFLFLSMPIFRDLNEVRQSKHYKPNEHYYYWTREGLIDWLRLYDFKNIETSSFETEIGRESIMSFVFQRKM